MLKNKKLIFFTLFFSYLTFFIQGEAAELEDAIREKDLDRLAHFLANNGTNIAEVGTEAIMLAVAQEEPIGLMRLLLATNSDLINATDATGKNVLMHIIEKGDLQAFNFLISFQGLDINHQDQAGSTALMVAADFKPDFLCFHSDLAKQQEMIKKLLSGGAQVSIKNQQDKTALHLMADRAATNLCGYSDMLALLLEAPDAAIDDLFSEKLQRIQNPNVDPVPNKTYDCLLGCENFLGPVLVAETNRNNALAVQLLCSRLKEKALKSYSFSSSQYIDAALKVAIENNDLKIFNHLFEIRFPDRRAAFKKNPRAFSKRYGDLFICAVSHQRIGMAARFLDNKHYSELPITYAFKKSLELDDESMTKMLSEKIKEFNNCAWVFSSAVADATGLERTRLRTVILNLLPANIKSKALTELITNLCILNGRSEPYYKRVANKHLLEITTNPAVNSDTCQHINTVLFEVMDEDDVESVGELFERYRNSSMPLSDGEPVLNKHVALFHAIGNGRKAIAKLLLEREEADANFVIENSSPLTLAARNNLVDVSRLLLRHGAKVDYRTPSGLTAFLIAAQNKNLRLLKLLSKYRADAHIKDENNLSALDYALSGDNQAPEDMAAITKFLMKKGLAFSDDVLEAARERANSRLSVNRLVELDRLGVDNQ